VTSRIFRIVALSLPVLLVCVLASTGGWRVHHGRVERVTQASTSAAPVVSNQPAWQQSQASPAPVDQMTFVRHLSPSVPLPAWAGLIVLCLLPAVASLLAWSGARRGRDATFSVPGGSP
jgi:hypothetical protein